ncbi:MAG: hypothetical protein IBX68_08500, partial [Dehalococcoidia bacterium]|nr:hypothetical protein [Dehalococcoidia bacterium]
ETLEGEALEAAFNEPVPEKGNAEKEPETREPVGVNPHLEEVREENP